MWKAILVYTVKNSILTFLWKTIYFIYWYEYVSMCFCVWVSTEPKRWPGTLGAGVISCCKSPKMCAGNQTRVFWKTTSTLSKLFGPKWSKSVIRNLWKLRVNIWSCGSPVLCGLSRACLWLCLFKEGSDSFWTSTFLIHSLL